MKIARKMVRKRWDGEHENEERSCDPFYSPWGDGPVSTERFTFRRSSFHGAIHLLTLQLDPSSGTESFDHQYGVTVNMDSNGVHQV